MLLSTHVAVGEVQSRVAVAAEKLQVGIEARDNVKGAVALEVTGSVMDVLSELNAKFQALKEQVKVNTDNIEKNSGNIDVNTVKIAQLEATVEELAKKAEPKVDQGESVRGAQRRVEEAGVLDIDVHGRYFHS